MAVSRKAGRTPARASHDRNLVKMFNVYPLIRKEVSIATSYWPVWSYLAVQDIKHRFRRSRLGVVWVVVQQLAFALGAGFIWAAVFRQSPGDFIPFLTIGFTIWGFVSAVMVEGCGAFVIAHGYLKQLPLPQSIFIFRTVLTQLFYLVIGLVTALGILAVFGKFHISGIMWTIPGLVILSLYAYGAVGAMAYLGLRYRDLQHGLGGVFSLLFVITPVIYPPEVLIQKGLHLAVYGNPFSALVEVVRQPLLLGAPAGLADYGIASLFAAVLIAMRFALATKWSRFVPFWS